MNLINLLNLAAYRNERVKKPNAEGDPMDFSVFKTAAREDKTKQITNNPLSVKVFSRRHF